MGRPFRSRIREIVLTVAIAYHVTFLFVFSLPSQGPTRGLHWIFTRYAQMPLYAQAIENVQNWGLFSPSPPRINRYTRVLVEDRNGVATDVQHDTYGRQRYPYFWYDYMRKVNRRLSEESYYHAGYAAWVCRTWERTHGGQAATAVRLVRRSTPIPPPPTASSPMSYDPLSLPVSESDVGRFECAALAHGSLPSFLRRRFGLE